MNIVNLQGDYIKWRPVGLSDGNNMGKSKLHLETRELIKKEYPTLHILEEVNIPIGYGHSYFLDFFIPLVRTAIEVHGEQHFKFNAHFYKTKIEFAMAKKRDKDKVDWCKINCIKLIILHESNRNEWRSLIRKG